MNNCPNCSNQLIIDDKIIYEYVYCEQCGFKKIAMPEHGHCCMNPDRKIVRFYSDYEEALTNSDDYTIWEQCQNCGRKFGNAKGKKGISKFDIPGSCESLYENVTLAKSELPALAKKVRDYESQKNRDPFWDDYNEYIQSERWKSIRDIVLKRDNHTCQSCLNAPAVEVHHTDGHYRKNEPLFTLISVCSRCHNIITEIERGGHKNAAKIMYLFDTPN